MPIYEYRCGTCGKRVEVLVRSSQGTPGCPDCGSPLTDRLLSTPNFVVRKTSPQHACCERSGQGESCGSFSGGCGEGCPHA